MTQSRQPNKKLRFSATPSRSWRKIFNLKVRLTTRSKPHLLPENKARERVLRTLLIGTLWITSIFCALLFLSYFSGNTYVISRLVTSVGAVIYLGGVYWLFRRRLLRLAAILLVIFYALIASSAAWWWSINMPFATLLMCVTITLAGILLGARYSLYSGAAFCVIVLFLQFLTTFEVHLANMSWQTGAPSLFGEAIGYCLLFVILALITWVFGRQIERSLNQARAAEIALKKEKNLLAVRLKERTEKLRAAQLAEMQQLYRFAELGQLSTALLHDLANHITSLTLDIEDLELRQKRRNKAFKNAKQSMAYLDELIGRVSRQLHDKGEVQPFDCVQNVQSVVTNLRPKFSEANVRLTFVQKGARRYQQYEGDPTRFGQVITILLTNALDATRSPETPKRQRRVRIALHANANDITVRISDWGVGLGPKEQAKLFKPFYSTKESGMGIGLFITKQIIETHFKGSVQLENKGGPTTFTVKLSHRKSHAIEKNTQAHTDRPQAIAARPVTQVVAASSSSERP